MADAWASATSTHALCPRRLYEQKKKKSAKWVEPVPVARRPKCTVALAFFLFSLNFLLFFLFVLFSIYFQYYFGLIIYKTWPIISDAILDTATKVLVVI